MSKGENGKDKKEYRRKGTNAKQKRNEKMEKEGMNTKRRQAVRGRED